MPTCICVPNLTLRKVLTRIIYLRSPSSLQLSIQCVSTYIPIGRKSTFAYTWKTDHCYNRRPYNHSTLPLLGSRLHMGRICISISCSGCNANMGKVQRYMGTQAHSTDSQCALLRRISHSGIEQKHQNVASRSSYTRNWWRRFNYSSQHLHQ